MKKLVVGILAHVDAGKTTLSEGLLYGSGALRQLGRVDHGNAFLDTDAQERERGITIFSKQAILPLEDVEITLLDTPGHVDFSSEMERTLQVLDYAILVIGGSAGVQGHTRTLWKLLERYEVPTFLFINKMDLDGADKPTILKELHKHLSDHCVDMMGDPHVLWEQVAMCDESLLERYLEEGTLRESDLPNLITSRDIFPCYFGSALKLEGLADFLKGLQRFTAPPTYPEVFSARVYKIARDPQGGRLTYLKVTGGELRVKDVISGGKEEERWTEKVDQIRLYSGEKFQSVDSVPAGGVCAVTGLTSTKSGMGLGEELPAQEPLLEPVLTYRLTLPDGCDPYVAMGKLRILEEEDPQLRLQWNGQLKEIHIQLMGEIQLEILQRLILDRFGWAVTFGEGNIVYRETLKAPVVGAGHFEPLRHYAEVWLLLEPLPRGSGLRLASRCSEDVLDRNWQRLILTHVAERSHRGVLVGAPITDIKVTLLGGRAHAKHTEGGDFRQATYRAIRQGLMSGESLLLEPWYDFRLELPQNCVGRAMSDFQRMAGTVDTPQTVGEDTVLTGGAPVSALRGYGQEVASYTKGLGRLTCTPRGYDTCHNQSDVVAEWGYEPERDLDHTADSVFCDHGAGFTVKWSEVHGNMHTENGLTKPVQDKAKEEPPAYQRRPARPLPSLEQDKELQAIFERTYGPIKRTASPFRSISKAEGSEHNRRHTPAPQHQGPEYLLVDGYNIIFGWDDLKAVAQDSLDAARQMLMDILCNYQGYRQCEVILVFDAYKVARNVGEVSKYNNIHVVYTKEAETADAYIEKTTYELGKKHRVRVATSDGVEQMIILGHGALRISARVFQQEVRQVGAQITALLGATNRQSRTEPIRAAMERAQEEAEK